jgi:hypothetical protein
MSESEEQSKGFKVTDRRSFTREGDPIPRADAESETNETPAVPPESKERSPRSTDAREAESRRGRARHVEAGFLDVLSFFATQASLALGVPHPVTGESHEDLETARVMIAMIEVLGQKTKGNLTSNEQSALDEILYQLRMDFMVKAKVIKT